MIDQSRLIEGMDVHFRGTSFFPSKSIRYMLNIKRRRELRRGITNLPDCWGNHDAPLIRWNGEWCVGDAQPGGAVLTPLDVCERDMVAGKCDMRFYWPAGKSRTDGIRSTNWWMANVKDRPYDYMAYPRIIFKCLFGDISDRAAGMEISFYCTEGWNMSWGNILDNRNATPYTVEKREESGVLENWTAMVKKQETR